MYAADKLLCGVGAVEVLFVSDDGIALVNKQVMQ
jgi:hypothetical protein